MSERINRNRQVVQPSQRVRLHPTGGRPRCLRPSLRHSRRRLPQLEEGQSVEFDVEPGSQGAAGHRHNRPRLVGDNPMTQKLYVGNLSYNTTECALRTLFAEFGEIESVNMITDRDTGRPKGFAFVDGHGRGCRKSRERPERQDRRRPRDQSGKGQAASRSRPARRPPQWRTAPSLVGRSAASTRPL